MREGQDADTAMVHSSCAMLLSKLIAKVGGYRQYTVLVPRAETGPDYVLRIDSICMLYTWQHCPLQLLAMMVDLEVPIQAKYTMRLTRARQEGAQIYQGNALRPDCDIFPGLVYCLLDNAVSLISQ